MSQDMKRKKTSSRNRSRGGTLLGMFIGLVLGVVIAAGVVFYMSKAPTPFVNKVQPAIAPSDSNQPPMALPGKPGDPVPEKRFQFYDILPGKTEAVPGKEAPAGAEPPKAEATQGGTQDKKEESEAKPTTPIYVQAGSFSSAQDADNLKANLAMMGLESFVQQVMVQEKTFYRLRLGPYHKPEEANRVKSELAKSGLEATLINKE